MLKVAESYDSNLSFSCSPIEAAPKGHSSPSEGHRPGLAAAPNCLFLHGSLRPNGPTVDLHFPRYVWSISMEFNKANSWPVGPKRKTREINVACGRCSRASPFAGRVAGPSARTSSHAVRNKTGLYTFCTKPPNLSTFEPGTLRVPGSVGSIFPIRAACTNP